MTKVHSAAGEGNGALVRQTALPGAAPHDLDERARGRREQPAARGGLARAPRRALPRRVPRVQPDDAGGVAPAAGGRARHDLAGRGDVELPGAFHAGVLDEPVSVRLRGRRDGGPADARPGQIERYQGRISGPLLDRIDLFVDVPRLTREELRGEEPAETVADRQGAGRGAREAQTGREGSAQRRPRGARTARGVCARGRRRGTVLAGHRPDGALGAGRTTGS